MAAIQQTRTTSSSVGGILVAAIAAALLIGGAGGYAARSLSVPASAPAAPAAVQHAAVSSTYELPAYIEKYVAPQEPRRFRVDEYLEGLSYSETDPIVDNATVGFVQQ